MDVHMAVAFFLPTDPKISVKTFCAQNGISRQTYYVFRRRFRADGLDGLIPRSRRPLSKAPVVLWRVQRSNSENKTQYSVNTYEPFDDSLNVSSVPVGRYSHNALSLAQKHLELDLADYLGDTPSEPAAKSKLQNILLNGFETATTETTRLSHQRTGCRMYQ